MAGPLINLNDYKASGVYTVEIDASENIILPLTTGRLIVGSSRIGRFNTVVPIDDIRTLRAIFGERDPKLEKAGSFFHKSIEVALREGPIFALNVIPLDMNPDIDSNLDKAYLTTFNTESASNNNSNQTIQRPIIEFFNRRRFWTASTDQLNRTKNIALNDTFITNPASFGNSSYESNKILSFVNTGPTDVTIWVKKSEIKGYDITAKEWYSTILGRDIEFPNFISPDDFISDYFVEVIIVSGDWTNYLKLSKDPIYSQYFNESGLKLNKASDFFALKEVKVILRENGCLIPEFKNESGLIVSIDRIINRSFVATGILCALDKDKLELVDLSEDTFTDISVKSHRIDLVGHGYDDLDSNNTYIADDGGYDIDSSQADPTPLIDILSYSKPADFELIFEINDTATDVSAISSPAEGELYLITPTSGNYYLIATKGSKLYENYFKGFLKNGDKIVDSNFNYFLKIQDGFEIPSPTPIPYIKILAYSDITLLNQEDINYYTVSSTDYVKIKLVNEDTFKHEFDLSDTTIFTDFNIIQPNKIVFRIDPATISVANRDKINEFFKVNHYIKAKKAGSTRPRLLKIISVSSKEILIGPSTTRIEYTITTMSPTIDEISGIEDSNNIIHVYKGIYNFVKEIKGQFLKGFKIREQCLPNGTSERQNEILSYLFEYTSIPQTLASGEVIDFRYIVDTYEGDISSSSKYYLAKLAATHKKCLAILNAPSVEQFEKSVDPSFIDPTNMMFSTELVAKGGDLDLNPTFTFSFAEETINGVPLSSYSAYFFPNLLIKDANKSLSIPPAAYVSNAFIRKFKNGTPFLIVAGPKRGLINDPEVIGVEFDLTDEDRAFLEPIGYNLIVRRKGFGTLILSNNTAYQRINSALNNAHVRDNLSTIERDIEKILFNFLFDFNDEITRLRIKTLLENYLESVINASGIEWYEVIFDKSNNTEQVISANTAIVDVRVYFLRGIHKFINRITITKEGGRLSTQSSGFIPSF